MPISNPRPFPALTLNKIWKGNASNVAVEANDDDTLPTPQVKVKRETREFAAASGNVSYTGYGLRPTGLIIFAEYQQLSKSIGCSEPAYDYNCLLVKNFDVADIFPNIVNVYQNVGLSNYQQGELQSYDADGFTINWSKGGTGSGTIILYVFAFK